MKQERIFKTKLVAGKEGSNNLFDEEYISAASGPVTCLGLTFENDEARRAHFTEALRKKLHDPEFRKVEGFPIGEDEDILNLSDPPYFTACPNPWLKNTIAEWEDVKLEQTTDSQYHREPFAANVSEGRSGIFYDAHSYHTKVPHKAIMRYILHYTEPGDIVLDSFAGTGMTAVAAQLCANAEVVTSLGYQVTDDGSILQQEIDDQGMVTWKPFSKLGVRRAIVNDLSPIAAFIAYNNNTPINPDQFSLEAQILIQEAIDKFGWLYETNHSEGEKGIVNYTIWSDVFRCPHCASEIVFWEQCVELSEGRILRSFNCKQCGVELTKKELERIHVNIHRSNNKAQRKTTKQVPVLINYSFKGKRYEKSPDGDDLSLIRKINETKIPYKYPSALLPDGFNTRQPKGSHGVVSVDNFYTNRNLLALAFLRSTLKNDRIGKALSFLISSYDLTHSTLMSRLIFKGKYKKPVLTGYQSGTLYISSLPVEKNVFLGILKQKLPIISKSFRAISDQQVISTGNAANLKAAPDSVDYIFIDPPFGANIMYSELNFLAESWMDVVTNDAPEAIENSVKHKKLDDYRSIMLACFNEAYRVLKPGHWITIEFSNTQASIWNGIQSALAESGFIVANVSALDKKQGSFKAVTTPTAVKQDLVISAYKPNGGFEERFMNEAQTDDGVWDFVRTHLHYLPIVKQYGVVLQFVPERDPRILFDQMVAFFVRKGFPVPISSHEFQIGLPQRFMERDGMFFLADQVAEYDSKKLSTEKFEQSALFVNDEFSALQWLRQLLKDKPQTFSDINPQFMKQLGGWNKNEAQLDLRELLNQNFLCYEGSGSVPEQIHSYLSTNRKEYSNLSKDDPGVINKASDRWYIPDPNKIGDLEKLREKALYKEFDEYIKSRRKLKVFRLEAVRAGFKRAWQNREYQTIVDLAENIPKNVLEEDPKLLMWFDQAMTRLID